MSEEEYRMNMNQLNVRLILFVEGSKRGLCVQQVHRQIDRIDRGGKERECEYDA